MVKKRNDISQSAKKAGLYLMIVVVLLAAALLFSIYKSSRDKEKEVCFDKECFNVELAVTTEQQVLGLSSREGLENEKGMLFVFSKMGEYDFWMKDMLFNLDIIWISDNKVVYIAKNQSPCAESCPIINPDVNSNYVLEVNAGTVDKLGILVGDNAEIKIN